MFRITSSANLQIVCVSKLPKYLWASLFMSHNRVQDHVCHSGHSWGRFLSCWPLGKILAGPVPVGVDHCLAWGEEELAPSLPLGQGGDCLWAGTGPSNYHDLTNFYSRCLQQGPGPCDGLQEKDIINDMNAIMTILMVELLEWSPAIPGLGFQQFAERGLRKEYCGKSL
jgi:hypothetical protein